MNNNYESFAKTLLGGANGGKVLKNLDKISALLKTEQGKKVISSIASGNPELVKKAVQAIASNDKASARKILSELMADEQSAQFAEKLMEIIG